MGQTESERRGRKTENRMSTYHIAFGSPGILVG